MYKLNYFVPEEAKEQTKQALFALGVGKYKNYECCCFETLGKGQFKPIKDANPYIGNKGKIEVIQEYKIEMLCEEKLIKEAISVLKQNHPYEEVAYEVIKLEDF
jgi:hypothetical protein